MSEERRWKMPENKTASLRVWVCVSLCLHVTEFRSLLIPTAAVMLISTKTRQHRL